MIQAIHSGGQVGVDIAALRAAKLLGLATGGYIPRGFRTLDGSHPEYAELYGLKETTSEGYPQRTRLNVRHTDATLIISNNINSPGIRLTRAAVNLYGKPSLLIDFNAPLAVATLELAAFIAEQRVEVLNVAGNADFQLEGYTQALLTRVVTFFQVDM